MSLLARYVRWLHTGWPAGRVEKMPEVQADGTCALPGVRVVGDLTGIPLLKFAADSGAKAVEAILQEPDFQPGAHGDVLDLVIVGGGVSGLSAALEAKAKGLRFVVYEAGEPFSTIVGFPKQKPIFTYPSDMTPAGSLVVSAKVKEALVEELEGQRRAAGIALERASVERLSRSGKWLSVHLKDQDPVQAQRVIVAIGRSGNYRRLNVPGEERDKVYQRLHDPKDYRGQKVLVVGGGDSALEAAAALAEAGAQVTLSYRQKELTRPKPENVEALARFGVTMRLGTKLSRIDDTQVTFDGGEVLPNDVVFALIGREPPLDFFRRSGIPIRGEWRPATIASFAAFVAFCWFVYLWKASGDLNSYFSAHHLFPFQMRGWMSGLFSGAGDPRTLLGTLAITLEEPGFYYSLAYTVCVVAFGFDRMRRRPTPYVRTQTLTLMVVQSLPLFFLPYLVLPYLGHQGIFEQGLLRTAADELFPQAGYGHGREYWRAFGFVLAWPLFIWNFFTERPMTWWLIIGGLQTFVLIPAMVWRYGKGAYCGWICSCGALAETLGDRHRQKMPHGPWPNRLNLVGQGVLLIAVVVFLSRVVSWTVPDTGAGRAAAELYRGLLSGWYLWGVPLNYYKVVDVFLAGIVGVGAYFWFSGRVWCRFACPLAALMHLYARFSQFRIFAEKKKCISCNVCTSVCHQGIDIMSFANQGRPMEDPQCVRCSACVQMCPTGVLSFGRVDSAGVVTLDQLRASAVRAKEASA